MVLSNITPNLHLQGFNHHLLLAKGFRRDVLLPQQKETTQLQLIDSIYQQAFGSLKYQIIEEKFYLGTSSIISSTFPE